MRRTYAEISPEVYFASPNSNRKAVGCSGLVAGGIAMGSRDDGSALMLLELSVLCTVVGLAVDLVRAFFGRVERPTILLILILATLHETAAMESRANNISRMSMIPSSK